MNCPECGSKKIAPDYDYSDKLFCMDCGYAFHTVSALQDNQFSRREGLAHIG